MKKKNYCDCDYLNCFQFSVLHIMMLGFEYMYIQALSIPRQILHTHTHTHTTCMRKHTNTHTCSNVTIIKHTDLFVVVVVGVFLFVCLFVFALFCFVLFCFIQVTNQSHDYRLPVDAEMNVYISFLDLFFFTIFTYPLID